jgi:hypothetical protein
MKRIVTLSVAFVTLAVGTNSQEVRHAPTLEVCNAQVNLWIAQMDITRKYGPEVRKVLNTLTSHQIEDRERLISDCILADVDELLAVPEGQRAAKAQKVGMRLDAADVLLSLYSREQRSRYFNFIARRHLLPNFDEEDQAGER